MVSKSANYLCPRWISYRKHCTRFKWVPEIKEQLFKGTRPHCRKTRNDIKSNENTVIINKIVRTALQESGMEFEDDDEEVLNLKPDIMIKEENRMIILDLACPYDLYLAELYEMKLNKY